MCAKPIKKEPRQVETTGHSWDGIEEYDNPMPRWWVWVFYATIVWGIGYTIAYPAWPLITGAISPGGMSCPIRCPKRCRLGQSSTTCEGPSQATGDGSA